MKLISETKNNTISYEQCVQIYHTVIAQLVEKYSETNNLTLLELGCGVGNVLAELECAEFKYDVSIVDIDQKCIDACEENFDITKSFKVDQEESLNSRIGPNSFDIVVCSHVIQYDACPHERMVEIASLLKADGLLVLAVPNSMTPLTILKAVFRQHYSVGSYSWDKSTLTNFISKFNEEFEHLEWAVDFVPLPYFHKHNIMRGFSRWLTRLMPYLSFSNIVVLKKI